jgi:hypothetical protein
MLATGGRGWENESMFECGNGILFLSVENERAMPFYSENLANSEKNSPSNDLNLENYTKHDKTEPKP